MGRTRTEEALSAVLRDVASTTDLALEGEGVVRRDGDHMFVMFLDAGFDVPEAASLAELKTLIADQIQDVVTEELATHRASNWPICPDHRSTHPMRSGVDEGQAVWLCPDSQRVVAPIGALTL